MKYIWVHFNRGKWLWSLLCLRARLRRQGTYHSWMLNSLMITVTFLLLCRTPCCVGGYCCRPCCRCLGVAVISHTSHIHRGEHGRRLASYHARPTVGTPLIRCVYRACGSPLVLEGHVGCDRALLRYGVFILDVAGPV